MLDMVTMMVIRLHVCQGTNCNQSAVSPDTPQTCCSTLSHSCSNIIGLVRKMANWQLLSTQKAGDQQVEIRAGGVHSFLSLFLIT